MAIFAIRSAKNVTEDSPNNPNNESTKRARQPPDTAARPTATVPEDMMQFDDDMAHFVTHLDADPLAESQLKMQLIEYNSLDDSNLVREIPDDEDEYTYFPPKSLSTRRNVDEYSLLSFQKLSYAAVTALLPPSRTPTPVNHLPGDRPGSSHSTGKNSRQRDFTSAFLQDNEPDMDIDWNAGKARRNKSRARGLARKRAVKVA